MLDSAQHGPVMRLQASRDFVTVSVLQNDESGEASVSHKIPVSMVQTSTDPDRMIGEIFRMALAQLKKARS